MVTRSVLEGVAQNGLTQAEVDAITRAVRSYQDQWKEGELDAAIQRALAWAAKVRIHEVFLTMMMEGRLAVRVQENGEPLVRRPWQRR